MTVAFPAAGEPGGLVDDQPERKTMADNPPPKPDPDIQYPTNLPNFDPRNPDFWDSPDSPEPPPTSDPGKPSHN